MKPRSCLAGLAMVLCAGAAGTAAAKPGYVPSTLNLRAAPGTTSEVVAKIPAGSLVDVGDCTDNWCAVTWQDKSGFSIQTGLDLSGRVPRRSAVRRYVPSDEWVPIDGPIYDEPPPVYVAPPPPYYYRYRPYWGPRWRHHW